VEEEEDKNETWRRNKVKDIFFCYDEKKAGRG
jgi:hypothetical protein